MLPGWHRSAVKGRAPFNRRSNFRNVKGGFGCFNFLAKK